MNAMKFWVIPLIFMELDFFLTFFCRFNFTCDFFRVFATIKYSWKYPWCNSYLAGLTVDIAVVDKKVMTASHSRMTLLTISRRWMNYLTVSRRRMTVMTASRWMIVLVFSRMTVLTVLVTLLWWKIPLWSTVLFWTKVYNFVIIQKLHSGTIKVLILYGNSEIGAHIGCNMFYLIWLRHLYISGAATRIFVSEKTYFFHACVTFLIYHLI